MTWTRSYNQCKSWGPSVWTSIDATILPLFSSRRLSTFQSTQFWKKVNILYKQANPSRHLDFLSLNHVLKLFIFFPLLHTFPLKPDLLLFTIAYCHSLFSPRKFKLEVSKPRTCLSPFLDLRQLLRTKSLRQEGEVQQVGRLPCMQLTQVWSLTPQMVP